MTETATQTSPASAAMISETTMHSVLKSRFPVLVPYAKELTIVDQEFASYIASVKPMKTYTPTTSKHVEGNTREISPKSRLIELLAADYRANHDDATLAGKNKTLTENADVAYATTGHPLLSAFYELKASAGNVENLLNEAWTADADATLKVIFNARSIHLGKADRAGAYKALGWLYQYHPQTLLANLLWLARPVIEKKVKKAEHEMKNQSRAKSIKADETEIDDEDFDMIDEAEKGETNDGKVGTSATFVLSAADAPLAANTTKNDVKHGVAHGYWKDLANILLLAVNDELRGNGQIDKILNVDDRNSRSQKNGLWDAEEAKVARHEKQAKRHARFQEKFGLVDDIAPQADGSFKALHLTIARLFASQLRADIAALNSKGKRAISFAAKWCPSPGESHDKQTFIVSSIAEAFFSFDEVCPTGTKSTDRTTYLKYARLALRSKVLSPLRKHLAIVERNITDGSYDTIRYERLPSLAIARYSNLFLKRDEHNFVKYLERVASGKSRISGAVLLPSVLVQKARGGVGSVYGAQVRSKRGVSQVQKLAEQRLLDGQWKTLVNRIKDSGKVECAIAVCDVSGSMSSPLLADGTCPMDSAIGLSLLLAEVCEPPFGGCFISFSETPTFQKVGGEKDSRSFADKVAYILSTPWGMNTNFVAVFDQLILPLAIKYDLKQEEMVKQVFVFSDMQFDAAQNYTKERWTTSHERIKNRFAEAGYQMPELVFWNLADRGKGAPVQADEPGVSLVSGYSQGIMKVFLDGGLFSDEVEEEVIIKDMVAEKTDSDGGDDGENETVEVLVEKKARSDPLSTVKRAISHPAYAMLKVVD